MDAARKGDVATAEDEHPCGGDETHYDLRQPCRLRRDLEPHERRRDVEAGRDEVCGREGCCIGLEPPGMCRQTISRPNPSRKLRRDRHELFEGIRAFKATHTGRPSSAGARMVDSTRRKLLEFVQYSIYLYKSM